MAHSTRVFRRILVLFLISIASWSQTKQQSSPAPAASGSRVATTTPVVKNPDPAQESLVVEHQSTKVAYQADGTNTRETTMTVRVQSQAGVQQLAVLVFPYTSYNENVEIDYVRVRKPDGTVVITPDYNIQDMPGDVTRRAPMYSDLHEKHVTVKGIGVGDVLEYLVRYRTVKPQVPGQFWFQYSFAQSYLAKDDELEIRFPREKYVNVESPEYQPHIEEKGADTIYTWKTANLIIKDRDGAKSKNQTPLPSVQLTTFHNWEEVGRWYGELQRPQLALTPQIQAKAGELTKGLTSDDDKIRAIYDYVSTHVHYVSLSFGVGRYRPHAAEDVMENEYGDCKDKHTLLAALLKAAGFEASPALINSSRNIDVHMPSPAEFDHVITVVPHKGTNIWLDTTPEVSPFGLILLKLRDKDALVIPDNAVASLQRTPPQPPFPSVQTFSAEGQLSKDGIFTAHIQDTFRGDTEVSYRSAFRGTSPAQWKELGQKVSYLSGFSGEISDLTASATDDTTKPFKLSYEYTKKSYGDWDNHRIVLPFPWFGLEPSAVQEDKPEEPVILGAVGKIVYESKTTLPTGYAPNYSSKLDLSEDFAEYHAKYAIDNGTLTATRELVIKKTEVPTTDWDRYKKFCKSLSDERDRYIDLQTGATSYPAGEGPAVQTEDAKSGSVSGTTTSDSTEAMANGTVATMQESARKNPEAGRLMRQGAEAATRRDLIGAMESFRKAAEIDPKYIGVHSALGWVYLMQNNPDGGLREMRLELEYHPEFPGTYQSLADTLKRLRRTDELTDVYRKWLVADPSNIDAALGLATVLRQSEKYSEQIQVLEKSAKLSPDSQALQYALGFAYLHNKQTQPGLDLLKKALASDSDGHSFNDVAYSLADMDVALDLAKEYGDKALIKAQADSMKADSDDAGLEVAKEIGNVWDTVGWIYFRRAEYDKALPYVRAAWLLSQIAGIGDHLGQVYAKLGRRQEAAHVYRLAYASNDHDPFAAGQRKVILQHYRELLGKDAEPAVLTTTRRADGTFTPMPAEELSRMRSFKLSTGPHDSGNAVFSVVFSPGKVERVKYLSGSDSLKPLANQIAALKFGVEFPDPGPVRLYRRGMVVCEKFEGCNLVLLLPDSVHVVDQYASTN